MIKGRSASSSVLCVVDINEGSMTSLQWAKGSAARQGCHLTILYPYRLTSLEKNADISQARVTAGTRALTSFTKSMEPMLKGGHLTYDFQPEVGFLTDRVLAHTSKDEILLIVMSASLAQSDKDGLQELIQSIDVPLVIVPKSKIEAQ